MYTHIIPLSKANWGYIPLSWQVEEKIQEVNSSQAARPYGAAGGGVSSIGPTQGDQPGGPRGNFEPGFFWTSNKDWWGLISIECKVVPQFVS